MGSKIGIVSRKPPAHSPVLAPKPSRAEIFWFAEIEAAFVHMTTSLLDEIHIDEDATEIENYIRKCRFLNPDLVVRSIKISSPKGPIAQEISYFPSLDHIMEEGELEIYFQPILKPENSKNTIYGLECLARISLDGLAYAPDFIFNYAQEKFCLAKFDKQCLSAALQAAPNKKNVHIFLNIRPQTLTSNNFENWLLSEISKNNLDIDHLVIEITEQSGIINEMKLKQHCQTLRSQGLKLAMDDFGLGASNLSMLELIDPQIIKVAGRFIKDLQGCSIKQKIVKNIVELAQDFGISAIVENVETKREWDAANAIGAKHAQGYYFSKPLSRENALKVIQL